MNFAVIWVAGYIAPRHLEAIKAIGNKLTAAVDLSDSVGILDRYGYDVKYGRDVNILSDVPLDWLSICTPNHLHLGHCLLGLELGANVICEKPLVIWPEQLDTLAEFEQKTGKRIYTVLQLRLHPEITDLKASLDPSQRYQVSVQYHTPRGLWYWQSWKGDARKSGGLLFNIGIHLFDLLLWLFGAVEDYELIRRGNLHGEGRLTQKRADVEWSLSICPEHERKRLFTVDGVELDLSTGFEGLHTEVYRQTLAGNGFGIEEARASIELCHKLTNS